MRKFEVDWFSGHIPFWSLLLHNMKDKPNLNFLEIGSFEGKSTTWLLDNILTNDSSRITCIDTFNGSYEHAGMGVDLNNLYNRFMNNISGYKSRTRVIVGESGKILSSGQLVNEQFDFVYVDGCHESKEVLQDTIYSFDLLKQGGIMILDDYVWGDYINMPTKTPKIAIDGFLNSYAEHIEILSKNYQVIIKKK